MPEKFEKPSKMERVERRFGDEVSPEDLHAKRRSTTKPYAKNAKKHEKRNDNG